MQIKVNKSHITYIFEIPPFDWFESVFLTSWRVGISAKKESLAWRCIWFREIFLDVMYLAHIDYTAHTIFVHERGEKQFVWEQITRQLSTVTFMYIFCSKIPRCFEPLQALAVQPHLFNARNVWLRLVRRPKNNRKITEDIYFFLALQFDKKTVIKGASCVASIGLSDKSIAKWYRHYLWKKNVLLARCGVRPGQSGVPWSGLVHVRIWLCLCLLFTLVFHREGGGGGRIFNKWGCIHAPKIWFASVVHYHYIPTLTECVFPITFMTKTEKQKPKTNNQQPKTKNRK